MAIGHAIDFFNGIGAKRKYDRLFSLKDYWTQRAIEHPKISVGTSLKKGKSGALALVRVSGKTPAEVAQFLFKEAKIHTVAIDWENIHGVRITPNVYTLHSELDKLVRTLRKCADS